MTAPKKQQSTNDLDFDLDNEMTRLEFEWRQGYEDSILARAEYQALAANPKADSDLLDKAREHLERTEALKARVLAKIERLENRLLGQN